MTVRLPPLGGLEGGFIFLQSIFLRIPGPRTAIFRRGDIEAVAKGELYTTRVVVFHLAEHESVAVERETIDAAIEDIVSREFDIKAAFAEILADTEREYRVGAFKFGIGTGISMGVHVEVALQQPVMRQGKDVAQLK